MTQDILDGILLDEQTVLSLSDLCRACSSSAEWIIELVDEGVLEPIVYQQTQWRFTGLCLYKARTAKRLQHDLGLNLAGIALVLDLLDEIDRLKVRLHRYDAGDER